MNNGLDLEANPLGPQERRGAGKRAMAGPPASITGGRLFECESCLAFFRGYSGERRHQLVHILTVAIRTPDLSLLDLGGVVLLREFLIAVLTVKGVLGHRQTPADIIAPAVVNVERSDEKPQILSSLPFRALERRAS
jgi:hypothetical protein